MAELTVGELLKRMQGPMKVWKALLEVGAMPTHFNGDELIALYKGEKVVVSKGPQEGMYSVYAGGVLFTSHAHPHMVGRVVEERRHIGLFE